MGINSESFASVNRDLIRQNAVQNKALRAPCKTMNEIQCTICPAVQMDYAQELVVKSQALRLYLQNYRLDSFLSDFIPSPRSRHYRSNSKRRVFRQGKKIYLGLNAPQLVVRGGLQVIYCPIEPEDHGTIYRIVHDYLQLPPNTRLRQTLNYVIIRGEYGHWAVLFSVRSIEPSLIREINRLSKELTSSVASVKSVFVFEDKPGDYYQSDAVSSSYAGFRKIWGEAYCTQSTHQKVFQYSPLSFSQTNASIVPVMVDRVIRELAPQPGEVVFDWYCGYGLLGLSVAGNISEVVGADLSPMSIASAHRNIRRWNYRHARYFRAELTAERIRRETEKYSHSPIKVILDPPRSGAGKGIIEQFNPRNVIAAAHLICNADLIPQEIGRWKKTGFQKITLIPLDMFPATDQIEMLAVIQP